MGTPIKTRLTCTFASMKKLLLAALLLLTDQRTHAQKIDATDPCATIEMSRDEQTLSFYTFLYDEDMEFDLQLRKNITEEATTYILEANLNAVEYEEPVKGAFLQLESGSTISRPSQEVIPVHYENSKFNSFFVRLELTEAEVLLLKDQQMRSLQISGRTKPFSPNKAAQLRALIACLIERIDHSPKKAH